jgi:hypothetical protein
MAQGLLRGSARGRPAAKTLPVEITDDLVQFPVPDTGSQEGIKIVVGHFQNTLGQTGFHIMNYAHLRLLWQ